MARIPINEQFTNTADQLVSAAAKTIIEAGQNLVCRVRATYPRSFSVLPFDQLIADRWCSDNPEQPPEPEQQLFTGGQCFYAPYQARIDFTSLVAGNVNNNFQPTREPGFTVLRWDGQLHSVNLVTGAPPEDSNVFWRISYTSSEGGQTIIEDVPAGSTSAEIELVDVTVTRLDGQPDDCGDPPPVLPQDPPRNSDDFSTTVQICDEDVNGNPINCRDIDITLPQEDLYEFPVCIVVDGRKICYGLDGWTVEDAVEAQDAEEEEEAEEEEIEVLDYVLVTVNQLPTKFNKRIVRPDAKDSEIFAGYLAWAYIRNGVEYFLPAIPIRKERNAFKPPEGIENYSVYFNFELTGTVTEVKKIIKVPKQPVETPV